MNDFVLSVLAGPGLTALHAAAGAGAEEVVELLLAAGADPSKASQSEGWTPLHRAVAGNPSLSVLKLLLDAGASVNARLQALEVGEGERPEKAELSEATPLLLAALSMPNCEQPVCRLLPRSPTRTEELQHHIARALIDAGANIDISTAVGKQSIFEFLGDDFQAQ